LGVRKMLKKYKRPAKPRATQLSVERLEERLVLTVDPTIAAFQNSIDHIVVVYQENWSFDALYGSFPGANGIANASATSLNQLDRLTGNSLSSEEGSQGFNRVQGSGVVDSGNTNKNPGTLNNPPQSLNGTVDTRFNTDPTDPNSALKVNTLQPYDLSSILQPGDKTGDIVHRYWQEQQQIDGGNMDKFITWSDNPGLVMSHFDASNLPEGKLAQQYTMDDNFFHAAYGGSFLNHQFLVSAAAPVYPNAPASMTPKLDNNGQLLLNTDTTSSSYGKIMRDGNITPIGSPSFVDPTQTFDQNYAVNTIFSQNLAAAGNNPLAANLLPSQNDSNPADPTRPYIQNIGDLLNGAGVSWKWYSGGWDNALLSSPSNPDNNLKTPKNPPVDPLFQWHHQPFAYYDNTAPFLYDSGSGKFVKNNSSTTINPDGTKHLEDENNFFTDVTNNSLPSVTFIKPLGPDNEHPGYTNVLQGQNHVAKIVKSIQDNAALWAHTAIIITYDEHGGRWDHVAPPTDGSGKPMNGIWGDGARVPAIVISPYAKKSYVDHTEHDTLSILKTIEERYNLSSLGNNGNYDGKASDLLSNFNFIQNHALILSVDGLRQPDVADGQLAASLPNILALETAGVTYTNATTATLSDSFPGTLAFLTGANPKTTGVYYDNSYDTTLLPPTALGGGSTPGTNTQFAENIDYNSSFIGGGSATSGADGNADASSIDPTQLPRDPNSGNPVYPHSFVQVNTIFNVAHDAGYGTAYSDKHPAYDIANGAAGNGVDEFFSPEVNANGALMDTSTHMTVNADDLLATVVAGGTVDLSKYQLVDGSTSGIFSDPYAASDPNLATNLENITHNTLLAEKYDDFKVQAILNEIDGNNPLGTAHAPIPNLFGMNFQAVSVAEKYYLGGIDGVKGAATPTNLFLQALAHTDASIGSIVNELKTQNLYDSTVLFLTAKHDQDPRFGHARLISENTIPNVLSGTNPVVQNTADDIQLLWLTNNDATSVGQAAATIQNFVDTGTVKVYTYGSSTPMSVPANQVVTNVLWGSSLTDAGLGTPANRRPDIIVTFRHGIVNVSGNPAKKFAFKRAEHGGMDFNDVKVPLIMSGGLVPTADQNLVDSDPVTTTQIAVSALEALQLDPSLLQGAAAELTQPLTASLENQVTVTRQPLTSHGDETAVGLTITNPASATTTLEGGFGVALEGVTPGITLESATITVNGNTINLDIDYDAAGNPIITIPDSVVSSLAPGDSLPMISLKFSDPIHRHVDFDADVFSDPFAI
jgi:phospholipase C